MTQNNDWLSLYQNRVLDAWIDYNNHMTEGYYGVVFGEASDAFLIHIGLPDYMLRTHNTFYTAENHLIFEHELKLDDAIHIETLVLGADRKRLHLFHALYQDKTGVRAATCETMLLHVNQDLGGVVPMPDELWEGVETLVRQHIELPRPRAMGRAIRSLR